MLTIVYDPAKSKLVSGKATKEDAHVNRILDDEFSFWVHGFQFSPKYAEGLWDGKRHLFSKTARSFPSGLLFKVLNILNQEGVDFEVEGYPDAVEIPFDSIELQNGITLRDYQLDPVRKILKYHRGVWEVATNGGKTETAAGLLKVLGVPPSVFIIPRRVLLKQTAERLAASLGTKVCMMGDGKHEFDPNGTNVCMFHTLRKLLRQKSFRAKMEHIKVLFADECHLLLGDQYQECFDLIPAEFRVGMSGTPFQKDKLKKHELLGIVGPVVAKVENSELMARGFSVRPSVAYLGLNLEVDRQSTVYGDSDFRHALEDNTLRNQVIANLARGLVATERQTVIMVNTVHHGMQIARHIPEAMFVHANSPTRGEALRKLEIGEIFTLICTPIFDTGLSVDHIEGLILAGGGISHIKLLQSIGRAIRVSKVKQKDVWVFDFQDHYNKLLSKHSNARHRVCYNQNAFNLVYDLKSIPEPVLQFLNHNELQPAVKFRKPAK